MSNENFINQRVQIPPSTCNPSSSNVLSRNFSKPPDNSIGSPTLFSGAYPAQVQLGRVAFKIIVCVVLGIFKIIVCVGLGILVNGIVHESIHWYRGQKMGVDIEDVCFVGLGRYPKNNTLGSMAGWVTMKLDVDLPKDKENYLYDETLPTVSGMISGLLVGVMAIFIII